MFGNDVKHLKIKINMKLNMNPEGWKLGKYHVFNAFPSKRS